MVTATEWRDLDNGLTVRITESDQGVVDHYHGAEVLGEVVAITFFATDDCDETPLATKQWRAPGRDVFEPTTKNRLGDLGALRFHWWLNTDREAWIQAKIDELLPEAQQNFAKGTWRWHFTDHEAALKPWL